MKSFSKEFWELLNLALAPSPRQVPESSLWKSKSLSNLLEQSYISIDLKKPKIDGFKTWDTSLADKEETVLVDVTSKGQEILNKSRYHKLDTLQIDSKYFFNFLRLLITYKPGVFGGMIPATAGGKIPVERNLEYLNLIKASNNLWYLTERGQSLIDFLISQESDLLAELLVNQLGATVAVGSTFLQDLMTFIPKTEWPVILSKLPAETAVYYGKLLRGEII